MLRQRTLDFNIDDNIFQRQIIDYKNKIKEVKTKEYICIFSNIANYFLDIWLDIYEKNIACINIINDNSLMYEINLYTSSIDKLYIISFKVDNFKNKNTQDYSIALDDNETTIILIKDKKEMVIDICDNLIMFNNLTDKDVDKIIEIFSYIISSISSLYRKINFNQQFIVDLNEYKENITIMKDIYE